MEPAMSCCSARKSALPIWRAAEGVRLWPERAVPAFAGKTIGERHSKVLRMNRGIARKLPVTSRQNQATMGVTFEPGALPGTSRSDPPSRTPHEINETDRPGIGRIACAIDRSVGARHHHRCGGPDDRRRIRVRPPDEEGGRTGD